MLADVAYCDIFGQDLSETLGPSDATDFALAVLLAYLPLNTPRSDVILIACMISQFWVSFLSPGLGTTGAQFVYGGLVVKVVLCFALGIHSLCVFCFGACSLLMYDFYLELRLEYTGMLYTMICTVSLITSVFTVLEWVIASYFNELRERLSSIQKLLDKETDGYCAVNRQTGRIAHMSKSLEHVLGEGLLGAQVLELIDDRDRAEVKRLYTGANPDAAEPALATFARRTPSKKRGKVEFDAKLVPYRFTASEVRIRFQVIGELRMTRGLMDGAADARDTRPSGAASEEERLFGLQEQSAALARP
ncbi:unnamed protein product [Prorocentrum cordatum]|uniref:PAS domain-containing protein n=1 Tax=Prorocentrum cordatum TaxID=2364126 RepID=A0ABN9VH75_9DINO|nr:unnamed protein product [Polarella glacialis]